MKEGRIPNSAEFGYLPKPSDDEEQLQADYLRWGYCRASRSNPSLHRFAALRPHAHGSFC